jgi:enolase
MTSKIKNLKAREILDSRGNPTVEVELITDDGIFFASVPSGASVGKYEAVELRDGEKRYRGRGVLKAVKNVNEIIAPKLIGKDPRNQKEIDQLMIELDGTKNKSKLGANAILAVSMAVCRAGAAAKGLPLWQYILSSFAAVDVKHRHVYFPLVCFNIINGGVHAGNDLDFQEFMIVPYSRAKLGTAYGSRARLYRGCLAIGENRPQKNSFAENLRIASEIYHELKETLAKKYGKLATNLGDEGGFAPPIGFPDEAIELILEAVKKLNYEKEIKLILDVASSQFFEGGKYEMKMGVFTREGLLRYYQNLIKNYPILGLEDPFAEDDFDGWKLSTSNLDSQILIIGDDLTATNPERIKLAKEKGLCNAMILKVNQIGTVSEALEAAKLAKDFGPEGESPVPYGAGWKIMVSHRSGETNDDFISDLAVGISADFIKAGAPARGERVAKYNRLLKIEEEIKD